MIIISTLPPFTSNCLDFSRKSLAELSGCYSSEHPIVQELCASNDIAINLNTSHIPETLVSVISQHMRNIQVVNFGNARLYGHGRPYCQLLSRGVVMSACQENVRNICEKIQVFISELNEDPDISDEDKFKLRDYDSVPYGLRSSPWPKEKYQTLMDIDRNCDNKRIYFHILEERRKQGLPDIAFSDLRFGPSNVELKFVQFSPII